MPWIDSFLNDFNSPQITNSEYFLFFRMHAQLELMTGCCQKGEILHVDMSSHELSGV